MSFNRHSFHLKYQTELTFQEEPTEAQRSLPVIVDNLLMTTPKLPPRTDLDSRPSDVTLANDVTTSRPVETDSATTLKIAEIKTKLEPEVKLSAPKVAVSSSPNSLLDPYIVDAKIETYGATQHQLTPPSKPSPSTAWSPNTVKVRVGLFRNVENVRNELLF